MKTSAFVALSLAVAASARPSFLGRRAGFTKQNGQDAIALNNKFKTLTASSPCQAGDIACVDEKFAQCVGGKFVVQSCAATLVCAALPLVNSPGTTITCTSAQDRDQRIAATGATSAGSSNNSSGSKGGKNQSKGGKNQVQSTDAATAKAASVTAASGTQAASATQAANATQASNVTQAANATQAAPPASVTAGNNVGNQGTAANSDDPQSSLTLLQSVIATGFQNDGQDQPTAGQVPSITSSNNFINFCATVPNLKITNGLQIKEGSCNPAPMGVIPSTAHMPSCKFVNPKNGATIPANQDFTVQLAIKNLHTGFFTNPNEAYFSAPQTVDDQGLIIGHSHIVIEKLPSLDSTAPLDPSQGFAFFKGLNEQAVNGVLSSVVPGGLPAGVYRIATINSAANHQPALVAIAQHGSLDDMSYFTVA